MKQVSYKGRNIEIIDNNGSIGLYIRVPSNDSAAFFGLIKNKKNVYYSIGNTHLSAVDFCDYESSEPILMNPIQITNWTSLEKRVLKEFSITKEQLDVAYKLLNEYAYSIKKR